MPAPTCRASPKSSLRDLVLCACAASLLTLPSPALTLTLSKKSTTKPAPGIVVEQYATTSPKTNVWVAKIDLCQSGIHVDATRATKALQSAATWGTARGAKLATNGDFYKTGPLRVYGDAVGEGVRWPSIQTGLDPAYKGTWYWRDAGWIAFLHDGVQFSHTGWQKKNGKGLKAGWSPTQYTAKLPAGVLALVGGFPELVVEGKTYTCSSPTASSCFPDRTDMRARHPRTAMGLTADSKTFLLVVVDGRTSASIGMYGSELAALMGKLGAWEAFNLDGGGSTQMWTAAKGIINNAKGNNNGGGLRSVANHWGILAGATAGYPARPGHCSSQPVCAVISAQGATLQETSPCFRTFGPPKYWRTEQLGQGGGLRWTNAGNSGVPDNWAWWRLELAEAGTYKVETAANKSFGIFAKTHYEVRAGGKSTSLTVNQNKSSLGWIDLGTHVFAAGGKQWVAVYDDHSGPAVKEQHIVADALRLTRVEPWCGSGVCAGGETCTGCPQDCGACPPVCGDGSCDTGESCSSCAKDCGACPSSCGDATCSPGESCSTCPADCGTCPAADAGSSLDAGVIDAGTADVAPPQDAASDAIILPDLGSVDPIDADADSDAVSDIGTDTHPAADGSGPADGKLGGADANPGQPDVVPAGPSAASSGCTATRIPRTRGWLGMLLMQLCAAVLVGRRRRSLVDPTG